MSPAVKCLDIADWEKSNLHYGVMMIYRDKFQMGFHHGNAPFSQTTHIMKRIIIKEVRFNFSKVWWQFFLSGQENFSAEWTLFIWKSFPRFPFAKGKLLFGISLQIHHLGILDQRTFTKHLLRGSHWTIIIIIRYSLPRDNFFLFLGVA